MLNARAAAIRYSGCEDAVSRVPSVWRHVLAEDALEGEAEPLDRRAALLLSALISDSIAAVAQRLEGVAASRYCASVSSGVRCTRLAIHDVRRLRSRASPGRHSSASSCRTAPRRRSRMSSGSIVPSAASADGAQSPCADPVRLRHGRVPERSTTPPSRAAAARAPSRCAVSSGTSAPCWPAQRGRFKARPTGRLF